MPLFDDHELFIRRLREQAAIMHGGPHIELMLDAARRLEHHETHLAGLTSDVDKQEGDEGKAPDLQPLPVTGSNRRRTVPQNWDPNE